MLSSAGQSVAPSRYPSRMTAVQSPVIPVVAEWIRQNPGTISLAQGVVYYGPPPGMEEQIARFLANPENHKYKSVQGIPELQEKLRLKLEVENGISIEPARHLVVTAGGNLAFVNAILAITEPGDEVILQAPYYFNHEMAVVMAGCQPVIVPTDENYQLQSDLIAEAITSRTRAVVTISPNNPTGAVYPRDDLVRVNSLCEARGLFHISDEAYEYFTYGTAKHFSPGSIAGAGRHTISLFSLSKAYGFASWRIGYMVIPEDLMLAVKKVQDTLLICPPVISQYGALGALAAGPAYCQGKKGVLDQTRRAILEQLATLEPRVHVPRSEGAFYFLINLQTQRQPEALVEKLIANYGVALLPGTAFGIADSCRLRLSYGALEKETAAEGLRRLMRGLDELLSR